MATKDLSVQEWFDEIDRGLEFRSEYGAEPRWSEVERLFYASHDSSASSGPNLLSATGDALLSTLTVPFPVFSAKPLTMEDVAKAPVVQAILNGLVDELEVPAQVEHMALSAYMYGVGIGKVGYDSEFGWDPDADIGGSLDPQGMTMSQYDKKGRLIEFGGTSPGMPWFQSVLPHDFVVPYGTHRLKDARWCAHRIIRHIDEVREDIKYGNTKSLQPCMSMEDFANSYKSTKVSYRAGRAGGMKTSAKCEYVEMWEIHDRATGKIYVVATGHDKFLREDDDSLQIDGRLPFIDLAFVPRSRSFWTTPDTIYLLPHQAELTDIHIQSDKNRRTNIPKIMASVDAFEEDQAEKLTRADVNPIIFLKSGIPIDQAVRPFPQGNNQNLYADADFVRRASREMVGFSANQFGEFDSSGRRSATEAKIVSDASNLRMDRRQTAVRDVYLTLAKKLQMIVFAYWSDTRITPYVGASGMQEWAKYQGTELKGKYKCKVSFTSEAEPSPSQEKQQALARAMTMAQMGAPGMQVLKYLLDEWDDPALSQAIEQGMQNAAAGPPQGAGPMGSGGPGQIPNGVPDVQQPPPGM